MKQFLLLLITLCAANYAMECEVVNDGKIILTSDNKEFFLTKREVEQFKIFELQPYDTSFDITSENLSKALALAKEADNFVCALKSQNKVYSQSLFNELHKTLPLDVVELCALATAVSYLKADPLLAFTVERAYQIVVKEIQDIKKLFPAGYDAIKKNGLDNLPSPFSNERLGEFVTQVFQEKDVLLIWGFCSTLAYEGRELPKQKIGMNDCEGFVLGINLYDYDFLGLIYVPGIKAIKAINASGNYLTKLPHRISELTNLEYLDLSSNCIEEFGELSNCNSLREFLLKDSRLKFVPIQVTDLANLTYLSLASNAIAELPEKLKNLTHLVSLDLENNQIAGLPEWLKELSLKIITLQNNKITSIEPLTECAQLEMIDVSGNKITTIPDTIAKLKRLETFYIQNNPLKAVPVAAFTMPLRKFKFK